MGPVVASVVLPAAAFAITFALITWMLKSGLAHRVLDRPNERSLHVNPVPRTGGLAVMVAVALAGLFLLPISLSWLVPATALAVLSFVDDVRGLPVAVRFAVQLAAAGVFAGVALPQPAWPWLMALALATAWMANLYNFMDGSDGLAGGMAAIGFGTYGMAALAAGRVSLATACFVITAAALAFLFFNFHPARIFMGDVGSVPLGFLAAALGALGWRDGCWPAWFPVLVFSPFIVDATVTLMRRLARRDKVWEAHRDHYYQRLVRLGLGHERTALIEYALMLTAGVTALWTIGQPASVQAAVLAGCGVLYVIGMIVVDRRWKAHSPA